MDAPEPRRPVHVTLVATPETQVAPLSGLYEALTAFPLVAALEAGAVDGGVPHQPFDVRVAAPPGHDVVGAGGLPLSPHCVCTDLTRTDVAVVPLMAVDGTGWVPGRYPEAVDWLREQHVAGALLASACTGVLLLAETGLLDGREATIHWAFADTLGRTFPRVLPRPEEVLITAGGRADLVTTGGVTSWHDLALHLTTRFVGREAAGALARVLMLEWHGAGQAPYVEFAGDDQHGDGLVGRLQDWLADHFAVTNPVEEMCARSGVTRRTLERRFRAATGYAPLGYVQQLRVREARHLLERTTMPVEQVAFAVGYENTAYFRRVFRRSTRLAPGDYRRRFGTGRFR
jgi:transcriptional regulator GlxA family with amidase domain